jgi:hypothetical protein
VKTAFDNKITDIEERMAVEKLNNKLKFRWAFAIGGVSLAANIVLIILKIIDSL